MLKGSKGNIDHRKANVIVKIIHACKLKTDVFQIESANLGLANAQHFTAHVETVAFNSALRDRYQYAAGPTCELQHRRSLHQRVFSVKSDVPAFRNADGIVL